MKGRKRLEWEKGRERTEKGMVEKGWRIGFWNVAGLENKNKDFWVGLGKWEDSGVSGDVGGGS